jgi:hypothetical protein
VAGEDVRGYLDRVTILADGKEIFRADRNELGRATETLAAYADDDPSNDYDLQIVDTDALVADFSPLVTTVASNFFFTFNMPHDYGMYKSVSARVAWRAVADEFVSASAITFVCGIAQDLGNVSRSIGLIRADAASSTRPNLVLNTDQTIIGGIVYFDTVDNCVEANLKGKDGKPEVILRELEDSVAFQALFNYYTGNVPADDDAERLYLPPGTLVPPYADRTLYLSVAAAEAVEGMFVILVAEHILPPDAVKGKVARGEAPVITTVLTGATRVAGSLAMRKASLFG